MLIIGGDFNPKIGKEGKLYNGELEEEREKRNLKDSAINEEGEKMLKLVEERGWHILNGKEVKRENSCREARSHCHLLRNDQQQV